MVLGGQSVLRFFSSKELRDFFENWFGNELGLPAPLLMAFLAKGSEFLFGIFIILGLMTRTSSFFLAIVMLVATLVANLDYSGEGPIIRQDGLLTISCFLFASLLAISGAGKFSLDYLLLKRERRRASD
jgi:putative oxidoreductase